MTCSPSLPLSVQMVACLPAYRVLLAYFFPFLLFSLLLAANKVDSVRVQNNQGQEKMRKRLRLRLKCISVLSMKARGLQDTESCI